MSAKNAVTLFYLSASNNNQLRLGVCVESGAGFFALVSLFRKRVSTLLLTISCLAVCPPVCENVLCFISGPKEAFV